MSPAVLWFATGLFVALVLWALRSAYNRFKEREALRPLHDPRQLTPEQMRARDAQRVAWYFNLPQDQQTKETWDWVITDSERE
jgi:hypothetical protein